MSAPTAPNVFLCISLYFTALTLGQLVYILLCNYYSTVGLQLTIIVIFSSFVFMMSLNSLFTIKPKDTPLYVCLCPIIVRAAFLSNTKHSHSYYVKKVLFRKMRLARS